MADTVYVEGLTDLLRACRHSETEVRSLVRKKLLESGQSVREEAQSLASANISHIGARWARMRIGLVSRGVYIAPASRRAGGSPRPNLGTLLLEKSMLPAVAAQAGTVERRLEQAVDELAARNW